jgi:hypothetical protein
LRDLYGRTGNPGGLANGEGRVDNREAQIRLLKPYKVPYTLPLTKPAGPVEFLERQIRNLAGKTRMEIAAHTYLCRDKRRTVEILLRPHSLIVVGGQETLVADFGAKTCAGSRKGWAPRDFRGVEVIMPW